MNELDTLKNAKRYIDRMAQGLNPLTWEEVPAGDLITKPSISKCLSYVSGILEKEINSYNKNQDNPPVKVGCVVTLLDRENGKAEQLKILPSYDSSRYITMGYRQKDYVELTRVSDADGVNSVSDESPLGKALIGKRTGEEVAVKTESGEYNYLILYVADS